MIITVLVLILLAILWPVTMLRVFSFLVQAAIVMLVLTVGFVLALHFV